MCQLLKLEKWRPKYIERLKLQLSVVCPPTNVRGHHSVETCPSTNVGGHDTIEVCPSANVEGHVTIEECPSANVGGHATIGTCPSAYIGGHDTIDACPSAYVGGHPLVAACPFTNAGGHATNWKRVFQFQNRVHSLSKSQLQSHFYHFLCNIVLWRATECLLL